METKAGALVQRPSKSISTRAVLMADAREPCFLCRNDPLSGNRLNSLYVEWLGVDHGVSSSFFIPWIAGHWGWRESYS